MPMATTEQSAATSIRVEQDINPGELVDDRSIVVAVTSRRKLEAAHDRALRRGRRARRAEWRPRTK